MYTVLGLVVVGFVLYLIFRFVPMAEPIRTIIIALVVILGCIWLLNMFGIVNIPVKIK